MHNEKPYLIYHTFCTVLFLALLGINEIVTRMRMKSNAWNLVADFVAQIVVSANPSALSANWTRPLPHVLMEARLFMTPYVGRVQVSCIRCHFSNCLHTIHNSLISYLSLINNKEWQLLYSKSKLFERRILIMCIIKQ